MKNFRTTARTAVALLFFTSGLGHLFAPGFFLAIMPPELPLHHEAVFVSGVFELLGAVGLGADKLSPLNSASLGAC